VLLGAALLPVRLALHVTGDLVAGFTIALRYRALGLIHGTRVLRVPKPPATTASSAPTTSNTTQDPPIERRSAPTAATEASAPSSPASAVSAASSATVGARLRGLGDRLTLLRRLLRRRALRIERPRGRIELALGDPSETGRAFGVLCVLATLVDPDGAVAIEPLWTETDQLATDLAVEVRIVPLCVALIAGADWLARRRRTPSLAATPHEGTRGVA